MDFLLYSLHLQTRLKLVKAVPYHGTHAAITASTKSPRIWENLAAAHVKGSHVFAVTEALVGAEVSTGTTRKVMVTIDLRFGRDKI